MRTIKRVLVIKNANHLMDSIILNGYSLSAFAKKVGISADTITNVAHKRQEPRPKTAKKIADGLGEKVSDIFLLKSLGKHSESKEMN